MLNKIGFEIIQELGDEELIKAVSLDDDNYKKENTATLLRCKLWKNKNNEIWTALKKDGELIGYINFMPISESAYEDYKNGNLQDWDIGAEHIVSYETGGIYNCLFMSIVVQDGYRNGTAARLLFHGLLQKIKTLKAERNIIFNKILFDCVSDITIKFCARHGFKKLGESKSGILYEGSIAEIVNKV